MLPRSHPDRIQIAFDDHRLVANAGLMLPATLARLYQTLDDAGAVPELLDQSTESVEQMSGDGAYQKEGI